MEVMPTRSNGCSHLLRVSCVVQVAAAKQAQQEQGDLAGIEEEVNGFLMGRLLERKPQLEQELLTFRDHLLASSTSSSDDLKLKVMLCVLFQCGRSLFTAWSTDANSD